MGDSETVSPQLSWTPEIDTLLAKWCDEAKCFEWMHMEAFALYESKSRMLILASNALTSISGLINLIVGGITIQGFQTSWIFGTISVVISITNMIQEKMAYSTIATENKHCATMWGIIRRKIEEELAIPRASRKQCSTFLNLIRDDINKVSIDGNSKIPETILDICKEKFGTIDDFHIPDICGVMEHTHVYPSTSQSTSPSDPLLTTVVTRTGLNVR